MTRALDFVGRHPWLPLGLVLTALGVLGFAAALFVALFIFGERAIGS